MQLEVNKRYIVLDFLASSYVAGVLDSYTYLKLLKGVDQFAYEGYIDEVSGDKKE